MRIALDVWPMNDTVIDDLPEEGSFGDEWIYLASVASCEDKVVRGSASGRLARLA